MDEESIFAAALEKASPVQRRAFLTEACAGDAELRACVEALLHAHENPDSFLEPRRGGFVPTVDEEQPIGEQLGTIIGPYKLLEQIGEGGFGIVFMAEQQQPVRRKVALKVLKPGMDTRQVVARFEAERQALALMDHPNIAHVFDGGATASGRPYFVMELVRGIPITDFCDQNQLPIRERLELFVTVCQAVQHAHQKGIIHRDLKPSNVLVALHDGKPLVKVIDFGIAKALGQERLTDKTLFTGFAHMIGTPLYMSPEQAEMNGQDTDTRTDIYALGVLLYELLTGTTPFDKERLKEASYEEIRRILREEEPPKPRTRISTLGQAATTVSANRKSEPKQLSHLFSGELDWIVMTALEKDRNRRYDTVGSLAADVQRYLHNEPVQACPPSALYRFRKFARRNKAALLTASAVGLTLLLAVIGLAASTVLVLREKAQTDAAKEQLQQALEQERQNSYYQRIALAEREWSANNLSGMEQLLDACPTDLRGWEWHYLRRLRLQTLAPLEHSTAVLSAVFSPDGRRIASGSEDGRVTIWDAATGRQQFWFRAHENHVRGVAFSPDGQRLATASWDKTVKVWDLDSRGTEGEFHPRFTLDHQAPVSHVVFSPDGTRLASSGDKKVVWVWDASAGEPLLFLPGQGHMAFSPDGQSIAAGSGNGLVTIWDAKSGQERMSFPGHVSAIKCVAFSSDGRWLASAATDMNTRADGEVKVWDLQTEQEALTLRGHVSWILQVAFSPDGRRLASAGMDRTIKLWDLPSGREVLTLRGHRGFVRSVEFSSDGTRLVSASHDKSVRIWDAIPVRGEVNQERGTLRGHKGGIRSVAFSPDGRQLASAGDDETVRIWDFERGLAGAVHAPLKTLSGGKGLHPNVAFSQDGKLLALGGGSGHAGGQLMIWDTHTWNPLSANQFDKGPTTGSPVAFSPDGRYLAAVSAGFLIEIRDATSGREIRSFKGHDWAIWDVAFGFDPAVPLLASTSADRAVQIWDVTAGRCIRELRVHTTDLGCVAFSPDGRYFACGSWDQAVSVWDAKTWQLLQDLQDATGGVQSVAFHPKDSQILAWGSTDGTVKLCNRATNEIRTLRGHTSWVETVAFSPDGEWIASGSLDGTVKIWEIHYQEHEKYQGTQK